ncbi:3',5'-cyclic-nucleotide phosphodiesterase [Fusarium flagelliforme]|uniref:3',5'-cyclic-nucleotide phosphodiesterase n=2 Tax=Fusarium flagelliforme TaxID=2675880 RepID=A0A395MYB1_9HYPO|nr:3',5'-cyclic-nucleotide phosphodiesterase [Fusarium flagelliforme]
MVADTKPALQVIVLGSGGGPQESNTTAFLVRSVGAKWHRGSIIAVDAGVHLSAITRIMEESIPSPPPPPPFTLTTGPFAGLELPYSSASANAAFVTRHLVDTYLITHPHLDHISGFVVNTAGFPGTRPKKLAALPGTIQAFKKHIFNNVIWPNLSDENNGAGLVTYMRLVEGGSPSLGDGETRGYIEVADGLLVKTWSVSHGHCLERHDHRGSTSSASTRFGSHDASMPMSMAQGPPARSNSYYPGAMHRGSVLLSQGFGSISMGAPPEQERMCVVDSSAYFIQDPITNREVLIFGDVEPDSLSLSPRNSQIWQEAAPKIASGNLKAIFIECSHDDSEINDRLYGHLKPQFVIEELRALASQVEHFRTLRYNESKKRKRMGSNADEAPRRNPSLANFTSEDPVSPKTLKASTPDYMPPGPDTPPTPHLATPTAELTLNQSDSITSVPVARKPLEGLQVVIIHVKDHLTDGPDRGEVILEQLHDYESEVQLGCEFVISKPGKSFYL